ncbi:MAG: thiamine-phosphate kinase [Candidatus Bathyarchaeota archaeon]|nr:MAG: thiamine-phosphate kinase [Candidatus Bathyarchaeota archaeon]
MATAKELGERKVIEILWNCIDHAPNMVVPFGDDVAAMKWMNNEIAVLKTDMLVGRTDVPSGMSYKQAARKAIVMNVSDFAAKGTKPLGLLVALGLPKDTTRSEIEEIGAGLNTGAQEYGVSVLGGDTSETRDLIIGVSMFGATTGKRIIQRDGSMPGDIVATTGSFGLTASGLKILKENLAVSDKLRKKLVDAVLSPHARLNEGLALVQTDAVTASIDSSDGLAWSLHEISRASNVGFIIDTPPIAPETKDFAAAFSLDPLELSLYGGEEYELVLTIDSEGWSKAKKAIQQVHGDLYKIGEVTEETTIYLKSNDEKHEVEARGYEHFKKESE